MQRPAESREDYTKPGLFKAFSAIGDAFCGCVMAAMAVAGLPSNGRADAWNSPSAWCRPPCGSAWGQMPGRQEIYSAPTFPCT